MHDYKLLCHFLRQAETAFSLSVDTNQEFSALADKFESGNATNEDREIALRILTNARENFSSMPDSEEKMAGMLETALIIQQLNMELKAP